MVPWSNAIGAMERQEEADGGGGRHGRKESRRHGIPALVPSTCVCFLSGKTHGRRGTVNPNDSLPSRGLHCASQGITRKGRSPALPPSLQVSSRRQAPAVHGRGVVIDNKVEQLLPRDHASTPALPCVAPCVAPPLQVGGCQQAPAAHGRVF